MFHDCHCHCSHEVYHFPAQGELCSIVDYEKTSNWDPALGDQRYAGIELEEWLASDEG
jgi:hypothetical protein